MQPIKKSLRILFISSYVIIAAGWLNSFCLPLFQRSGSKLTNWTPKEVFDLVGSLIIVAVLLGCASGALLRHQLSNQKPIAVLSMGIFWKAFGLLAACKLLMTPLLAYTTDRLIRYLVGI